MPPFHNASDFNYMHAKLMLRNNMVNRGFSLKFIMKAQFVLLRTYPKRAQVSYAFLLTFLDRRILANRVCLCLTVGHRREEKLTPLFRVECVCECSYMHMRILGLLRSWKGHCSQRGMHMDNTHSSRSWLTSAVLEERCEHSLSQVEL